MLEERRLGNVEQLENIAFIMFHCSKCSPSCFECFLSCSKLISGVSYTNATSEYIRKNRALLSPPALLKTFLRALLFFAHLNLVLLQVYVRAVQPCPYYVHPEFCSVLPANPRSPAYLLALLKWMFDVR
jgi:hypothetical protein